jgi:hypothetical protein
LAFFAFEHYPMEPGKISWSSLYNEADLVTHIMQVWREDGVPVNVPLFITESNISWQSSESFVDVYGALWLADYIAGFLTGGGDAVYYFHYLPMGPGRGHNGSFGTFGFFATDKDYKITQPLSQYFASQLLNLEWVQPGNGAHKLFAARSDVRDPANHRLVTAYAALRPDGDWSLLVINKDQENAHTVSIQFDDAGKGTAGHFAGPVSVATFGKAQYVWHPSNDGGKADPDGPLARSTVAASAGTPFMLPAASITVFRGHIAFAAK